MAPRASRVITPVIVLLSAVSVAALGRLWLTGTIATATGPVATMDGVTVEVRSADWAPMDHAESGRAARPARRHDRCTGPARRWFRDQDHPFFDVEVPESSDDLPPLYLTWSRDRDTVRIPVVLPGEVPDHSDH